MSSVDVVVLIVAVVVHRPAAAHLFHVLLCRTESYN